MTAKIVTAAWLACLLGIGASSCSEASEYRKLNDTEIREVFNNVEFMPNPPCEDCKRFFFPGNVFTRIPAGGGTYFINNGEICIQDFADRCYTVYKEANGSLFMVDTSDPNADEFKFSTRKIN